MKTTSINNASLSTRYGVVDGVAGRYTSPKFIESEPLNYMPSTRQHFENVARQLNRSVEVYKLEKTHGR